MKLRERSFTVTFPVWRTWVKTTVTNDVFQSIKRHDKSYTSLNCEAMCMHADGPAGPCSLLILHEGCSPGIVAHECWHAIRRMLNNLDVGLENETVAYHLGYLVNRVHNFMENK